MNFPIDDSLVAEGQHHNELFAYYPDFSEGRTKFPGDSRAALAPLLAHKALAGEYKWILYGDDDTIWFLNGVVQLLQNLDPSMPYIVTGDCLQVLRQTDKWKVPRSNAVTLEHKPKVLGLLA